MKTLSISDQPQVLVLYSDDLSILATKIIGKGFNTVLELISPTNHSDGLLQSSKLLSKNEGVGSGWYKVIVVVSSFQIFSKELLAQLENITSPLLFVIPVVSLTYHDTNSANEFCKRLSPLFESQSTLLNQISLSLPTACLTLIDGLFLPLGIISSNTSLFQVVAILNQEKPLLPQSLSILRLDEVVGWVLKRIASPQVGKSTFLTSNAKAGNVIHQKLHKFLEQCYQLRLVSARFIQFSPSKTPPLSVEILPGQANDVADFVNSTPSPTQLTVAFNRVLEAAIRRLRSWRQNNEFADPPRSINLKTKTDQEPSNLTDLTGSSLVKNSITQTTQVNQNLTESPEINKNHEKLLETNMVANSNPSPNSNPNYSPTPPALEAMPEEYQQLPSVLTEGQLKNQELDSHLAGIFNKKRVVEKSDHQESAKRIKSRIRGKSKRRRGLFVGGALLTGFSLAILFFVGSYSVLSNLLNSHVDAIKNELAVDNPPDIPVGFLSLTKVMDWQNVFYDHLFDESMTQRSVEVVGLAKILSRLSLVDQNWQQTSAEVLNNLFVASSTDLLKIEQAIALQSVRADIWQELASKLQLADQEDARASLDDDVKKMSNDRVILSNLSPHLSQLLGFDRPQKYAVIFQNTQELRSTGGFIQSVGLVTVDRGQVTSTRALSSYEIDKLLGGAVEPPSDLTKQLGEKQLFFRDSNWNPDFPSSAQTMLWLLEKSLNVELDGMLALTTASLQDLLSITGPLELPNSSQSSVVSAQNLLDRLEYNSGVQGLTPNQPREYSTQVLDTVLAQLSKLSAPQTQRLIVALGQNLNNTSLLAYHKDQGVQQVVEDLGWSGGVLSPPCPAPFGSQNCRIDPLYINENNVGINKANQYLQRKNFASILLDQKHIKYAFRLSYENYADVSSWPKGSYLAYARAFLPPNATEVRVLIDGLPIPEKDLLISSWDNRSVVGYRFEVPIKSTKQVELEFTTPPLSDHESFVFFMQKQPGVTLDQSQVEIRWSGEKSPQVISPGAVVEDGRVLFSPTPNPHLLVGVSF